MKKFIVALLVLSYTGLVFSAGQLSLRRIQQISNTEAKNKQFATKPLSNRYQNQSR